MVKTQKFYARCWCDWESRSYPDQVEASAALRDHEKEAHPAAWARKQG